MKKRLLQGRLALVLVMMVVLLSACSHGSGAGYTAKANLQAGDAYKAHFVTVMDSTMTVNGTEQKSNQVSEMDMSLKVQSVDQDHNATVQCKFTAVKSSQSQNGEPSQDLSSLLNQLFAGKGFSAKVSPRGTVLAITGLDTLIDQALEGLPLDADQKRTFKTVLQESFSEQNMKMLFATFDGHFPDKPVEVGDTWNDTTHAKMFVPIDVKTDWKFVADKDGILSVSGKGTMSVPSNQANTKIMGVDAKMTMDGDFEETLQLHKDHLFEQTGTTTEHAKGTIEVQRSGETAKVPMTIETKRTFAITKQ